MNRAQWDYFMLLLGLTTVSVALGRLTSSPVGWSVWLVAVLASPLLLASFYASYCCTACAYGDERLCRYRKHNAD